MDLPDQYTYISIKNDEKHKVFRVKELTSASAAEAWVDDFSKQSYVTWRVTKTYPNVGRKNIFRKHYHCQHLTDKRVTGAGPSKNTDCPAKMEVIVRRYVENSRAKTVDILTKEFPCVITLKEEHNHPIYCAHTLQHRDMAPETKKKLAELFRQGHNLSSAHYFLNIDLMLNSAENYYKVSADSRYLPTLSTVAKLFQREFENEYGSFSGDEMFENLRAFLAQYESTGGKAKFNKTSDNHYYVVLCTPVMLRAHEKISQSGDLVMLDASGGMDKQRHRLYAFVTPTAAGGLPLGIIVTDCEKEDVFTEALLCYRDMLSEIAFFSKGYPQVFLTDNDMKERNALNKVFPQSTLLLCQFHILKSMWSWLCNKKHEIDNSHRQELYFLFKNIVYAFDEALANEASLIFVSAVKNHDYKNLLNHFANMWEFRKDWASCFRKQHKTHGNNTTNYVEIVFRILKDIIFDRVLAYNVTQLVDFIATKYEMYVRQRLVSFANGRYTNSLLVKMLPQKCDLALFSIVHEDKEGHFKVTHMDKVHVVDMVRGICSCDFGSCGRLCKHASAVFLKLEHSSTSFNIVNNETKALMMFVAEGVEPNADWFEPLQPQLKSLQSMSPEPQMHSFGHSTLQSDESQSIEPHDIIPSVPTPSGSSIIPSITDEERMKYQTLLSRIEEGLCTNPSVFVPAFKKMLTNADDFASTQSGLVSAMHTFGSYSGVKAARKKAAKQLVQRSHRTLIGVQPTAPGIRPPPKELSHHD